MPEDLENTENEENVVVTPELKVKSVKEERDNLEITFSQKKTYVIVAAIHKDHTKNVISKISCKKGIPIGGYVFDAQTESYQICCSDYLLLGYIPVSMTLKVAGMTSWEMRIPLAEPVVKRYLTSIQKKDLRHFKSCYKPDNFTIQFVQMISCS